MNLLDILIAKKKSFTGETESLVRRANEAMAQANTVAEKIEDAGEALAAATEAQEAAEAANAYAQEVINDLDSIKEDISSAAAATVASIIEENTITSATVESANTSAAKIKRVKFTKNNDTSIYEVDKNYTATGQNEDGGMTQKAITAALESQRQELQHQIDNIPTGGSSEPSGGGTGNISGNITSADVGKLVTIDANGEIIASTITEDDIIRTQIAVGTLDNEEVIGLETDYVNKISTRIQGAKSLSAGESFNKYDMYGGRKRCIVNEDGSIDRFVTAQDTSETLANKRIMVYQPAFYYYHAPITTANVSNGVKINKDQLLLSDTQQAGFKLHPMFIDANGNPVKYVLLPAYESGTLRANGSYELGDAQDIDFANDKLVSVINTKPISGVSQNFTFAAAEQMAANNGTGWQLTDMRFESLEQMLMMVEFGTLNIQSAFNKGLTSISTSYNGNNGCITGSTLSLLNTSGRAVTTTNITDQTYTYTTDGSCAISYRGLENPYGDMWRYIGNAECRNKTVIIGGDTISFTLPPSNGWLSAFGYDERHPWIFLPIEASNANSSVPIGDYLYVATLSSTTLCLASGTTTSNDNAGIFYYAFDTIKDNTHRRNNSARVMHIPTSNSTIEINNYNLWKNS